MDSRLKTACDVARKDHGRQDEQWMVGAILTLVLVGVANTVLHTLARQYIFASINGVACLVALWCIYRIFLEP